MKTQTYSLAACALALTMLFATPLKASAQAVSSDAIPAFSFIALGDMPYGPPAQSYPPYRKLIEHINGVKADFSIHIGDIKSGSTPCTDEEFTNQLEHFQRYRGAVVYTPGDNEWTDCHRANNGSYDPLERLASIRQRFFTAGKSLGQTPLALTNQSTSMPEHARYVENQRWMHRDVMFVTVHMVGSNNNLESRDLNAAREFFERDAANIAWIKAAFDIAQQQNAKAIVIAMQADVLEARTAEDDFPGWSGFKRSIEGTLLPLAQTFGKPVLLVSGDTHEFRLDQPFRIKKQPLRNLTRLVVPGATDIRAVRVHVMPNGHFGFELLTPPAP